MFLTRTVAQILLVCVVKRSCLSFVLLLYTFFSPPFTLSAVVGVVVQSDADTMEIMDTDQMDRAAAMWAVYAFVVANLDEMLPRLAENDEAPTQQVRSQRLVQNFSTGTPLPAVTLTLPACE